jgi:hypothetical protein
VASPVTLAPPHTIPARRELCCKLLEILVLILIRLAASMHPFDFIADAFQPAAAVSCELLRIETISQWRTVRTLEVAVGNMYVVLERASGYDTLGRKSLDGAERQGGGDEDERRAL